MSDIWDNVAAGLLSEVHVMLDGLKSTEYFKDMGSEIERAFAGSLVGAAHITGFRLYQGMPDKDYGMMFLAPQVKSGDYRVDFVLGHSRHFDRMQKCIVIECDGHAFHEKTKDQAARDKSRDRFLSSKFGRVLRFTGSEIYRDPTKCSLEALQIYASMLQGGDE